MLFWGLENSQETFGFYKWIYFKPDKQKKNLTEQKQKWKLAQILGYCMLLVQILGYK